MAGYPINPDAQNLEDAFFVKQNQELLKKLREKSAHDERREALRTVVKTGDDAFLDHLLELGIGAETALALTLVPLAAVAWADGSMEAKERTAILKAAEEHGMGANSPARQLLETWLENRPKASLIDTWKRYVQSIWSDLAEPERRTMRDTMIGLARTVAEASGGFLGLTSKISAEEQAVLEDLERTLG